MRQASDYRIRMYPLEVRLTDPECESRVHILAFLRLVEGKSWPEYPISDRAIGGTLDFATKYECPQIQQGIMRYIWRHVSDLLWETFDAGRLFAMAGQMHDISLCGDIIRRCIDFASRVNSDQSLRPDLGDLDPSQLSEACANRIPYKYYWALVRVQGAVVIERCLSAPTTIRSRPEMAQYGLEVFHSMVSGEDPYKEDERFCSEPESESD